MSTDKQDAGFKLFLSTVSVVGFIAAFFFGLQVLIHQEDTKYFLLFAGGLLAAKLALWLRKDMDDNNPKSC